MTPSLLIAIRLEIAHWTVSTPRAQQATKGQRAKVNILPRTGMGPATAAGTCLNAPVEEAPRFGVFRM
jgi:hypothetical protein